MTTPENKHREKGPGGGRRDHRDDGCWLTLTKPIFTLTLLILIRKKIHGSLS